MPVTRKRQPTSIRLDEFQREALQRIGSLEDRSMSYLISRAVDRYVAEELSPQGVSRASYERQSKDEYARQLLASFQPKPFRVPTDEELAAEVSQSEPDVDTEEVQQGE